MGSASEGAAPTRRLALVVLVWGFSLQAEPVIGVIPSSNDSYLQNGAFVSQPRISASSERGLAKTANPYGLLDVEQQNKQRIRTPFAAYESEYDGWDSANQEWQGALNKADDFSLDINNKEKPQMRGESVVTPARSMLDEGRSPSGTAGRLFARNNDGTSGRGVSGAHTGLSTLQVADQLKSDGEDESGSNKSGDSAEEGSAEKGDSQNSESNKAEGSESEQAASSANDKSAGESNAKPESTEGSASSDPNKSEETKGESPENSGESGESKTAEATNESKNGSEEEKNEADSSDDKESNSGDRQSPPEAQTAEADKQPSGEGQAAQPAKEESNGSDKEGAEETSEKGDDSEDASKSEDKAQTDKEPEKEKGESAANAPEAEKKENDNEESKSAADSQKAEGEAKADKEPEGKKSESEALSSSEHDQTEQTTMAATAAPPASTKPSEQENEPTAPTGEAAVQPSQEANKESGESVKQASDPEVSSQPSQQFETATTTTAPTAEAAEATQPAVQEQQETTTQAQVNNFTSETSVQGPWGGSSTSPLEGNHTETVEGTTIQGTSASDTRGKCYTNIAQQALEQEKEALKKAAGNVHFQEIDQAFCDELFRRIDGPYSLADLSSLLRAADVADSLHRNFRYCRATSTSSPPRVRDGDSIVHAAIAARKPHVLEVLLQYGAYPEMPSIPQTPRQLDTTAKFPFTFNTAESMNARPIHAVAAIQSLDSMESMELLLQYGANVNHPDTLGRTPLMVAAYHPRPNSHEFVKKLILSGADVHATDRAGLTALHYASASDNWPVLRILLDHGADPAAADLRGNTPLHYAAAFNTYNATTKLLEKAESGLNINQQNFNGKAPIHLAAAPDSYRGVPRPIIPAMALEALLMHHANPMARDAEGNNPLHLAARRGYVEIVRRLVALTSIPAEEKNLEGQTPLDMVMHSVQGPSRFEIEQFLQVYSEKKSCIEPPIVRHSTRIFSDTVLGSYMRVGDTVTYTCNDGFSLFGHATLTCQERDGKMEFVPTAPLCQLKGKSSAVVPWPSPAGLTLIAIPAALFFLG